MGKAPASTEAAQRAPSSFFTWPFLEPPSHDLLNPPQERRILLPSCETAENIVLPKAGVTFPEHSGAWPAYRAWFLSRYLFLCGLFRKAGQVQMLGSRSHGCGCVSGPMAPGCPLPLSHEATPAVLSKPDLALPFSELRAETCRTERISQWLSGSGIKNHQQGKQRESHKCECY